MYKKFDTQRSLIIVFAIISCLVLFVFSLVILQQTRKNENYDAWVIHTYEVLRTANRLVNNVSELESTYRGYFLTGTSTFLAPVATLRDTARADMDKLEQMMADNPEQVRNILLFRDLYERYIDLQEAQRQIYLSYGASGLVIADIKQSQNLMNVFKVELESFISTELKNLTRRMELRRREQFYHVSTIVTGSGISIIGLLTAGALIMILLSISSKTARRLHDVEELYSIILENTNDGIYDIDMTTGKVVFSDSCHARLGTDHKTKNGILHDNFLEAVHPDDYDNVLHMRNQFAEKKIPHFSVAYRLKHKDDYYVWILDRAVGTWDENNKLVRMVGIHTDITEQKKQEEALRELNVELESFTYIASHDLRGPLVNIKGFAKEIEGSLEDVSAVTQQVVEQLDKPQQTLVKKAIEQDIPESLGFIYASVEKMDSLTNAILNLSRIGRRIYKPVQISMKDMVQKCLKSLKYELNERQVNITVSDLPDVYADELAVEQIFGNILENAVKYLSPDREGMIHVSALEAQNEVIFAVRDNGRGIRDADKHKIFDIFQRARNAIDVRGAGMGLAFVRATVRKMGGRIWFESEENTRTTFYIALPRLKEGDRYAS